MNQERIRKIRFLRSALNSERLKGEQVIRAHEELARLHGEITEVE